MKFIKIDALIIGGGIAGLWALMELKKAGYSAILAEKGGLGGGQTLASQGIIHSGAKYAISNKAIKNSLEQMPNLWKEAISSDLEGVKVLSEQQYLWTQENFISRLVGKVAQKMVKSRMSKVLKNPAFLAENFAGDCYELAEPVIDIPSLLEAFIKKYGGFIWTDCKAEIIGNAVKISKFQFLPRKIICCAGEENANICGAKQQLRPLNMLAWRVPKYAPNIYGHLLAYSDKPKLTITTHQNSWRDIVSGKVYWLGGEIAEKVNLTAQEQITEAKKIISKALPHLNLPLNDNLFSVIPVNRAEAFNEGKRPDLPSVVEEDELIISAYPTKLAFAPLLAQEILKKMPEPQIKQPILLGKKAARVSPFPWTGK